MVKEYEISSIFDLLNIPSDRLHACLRDLQYGIEMMHLTFGEDASASEHGPFVWKDDGDHSVVITFPAGDTISLTVTDCAP